MARPHGAIALRMVASVLGYSVGVFSRVKSRTSGGKAGGSGNVETSRGSAWRSDIMRTGRLSGEDQVGGPAACRLNELESQKSSLSKARSRHFVRKNAMNTQNNKRC